MPKKEKAKVNVKERVEDNLCDLSLSELNEVPVSQIASFKRVTILDLSSNRLTTLGKNFTTLTRLVKIDLSKNALKYLPEEFGLLHSLRHLDLYDNKLEHLPLSFGELVNLRYLDLKGNPLVPALLKIVGFCSTTKECQESARNTVKFMASMQIEAEKLKETVRQQQEQTQDNGINTESLSNEPKMNSDDNNQSHSHPNDNQNAQNQLKIRQKSNKKSKPKGKTNSNSNSISTHTTTINHKSVQTMPVEITCCPLKNTKSMRSYQSSTALSSILTFFILLIFNIILIYIVMFKNPEIAEMIVNFIPQQYRNWLGEKTEIFRLRVTDWIGDFITPPEEH